MKLLIIGHGQHGKDTVADIITEIYGLRSQSSSLIAAETIVIPWLSKHKKIEYDSLESAYNDRVNYRYEWFQAIREYTEDDPTKLAREVLEHSQIYTGMRSDVEFYAARHLFDYVIGVAAFNRKPIDPTFLIPMRECDYIVNNDGDLDDLELNVRELMEKSILK